MDQHPLTIEQQKACEAIESANFDFTATYLAAFDLNHIAHQRAEAIQPRTVKALKQLLLSSVFDGQRQRRFLFREAATVLATIVQLGHQSPVARQAYDAMQEVLYRGRDHGLQAAADALGSLPVHIDGPRLRFEAQAPVISIEWKQLLKKLGQDPADDVGIKGRSLLLPLAGDRIAVVKMARAGSDTHGLRREIQWMSALSGMQIPDHCRFDVPEAVTSGGAGLFQIKDLPTGLAAKAQTTTDPVAVVYIATEAYFQYPNARPPGALPSAEEFLEMMGRNAFLFAWLAGRGIVHEAPIPLFHNRMQQERRRDGGMYEWFRAGRLDRWLASCDYPNFGKSGLRDFEHFETPGGKSIDLFRSMGHQLLSLLLVAGSYFRSKAPHRFGWDGSGRPVDSRDLFDRALLVEAIHIIFRRYHTGFVGASPNGPPPVDVHHIADRMIAEMGVDRHMVESLRVVDQMRMSRPAFETFLMARGYDADAAAGIEKGAQDLDLMSGPHLGAFNRGISLPELIDTAAAMAATCVAGRYLRGDFAQKTTSGR